MKKLLVSLLLCLAIGPVATAQEPDGNYVIFFPIIGKAPPWPYDLKAEALALQPANMPAGYELEADSGPIELSDEDREKGVADAYRNSYSDLDRLFTGTLVVASTIMVFETSQDAQDDMQRVKKEAPSLSGFKRFRKVSRLGDETIAFELQNNGGLFPITGYFIVFRRGNIESWIATGGIVDVAPFDDAVWFARKSLTRIDNHCCNH